MRRNVLNFCVDRVQDKDLQTGVAYIGHVYGADSSLHMRGPMRVCPKVWHSVCRPLVSTLLKLAQSP